MADGPFPAIPGYEIRGELARGGGGIVYRAWQERLERTVAIKVIRPEHLLDPEVTRRFQHEAKAAARLSHPNIVSVIDFDEAGGTHYLVMEYIDGIDLARLVANRGPLPVEQVSDFIRQTALGLEHAHQKGLVHRDIKPSNLMVARAPDQAQLLKVLDFGLARVGRTERDGGLLGTPDFMAPEQIEAPEQADIRADLYALGCTFYHLLAGSVPFPGGSMAYKLERQRSGLPVPIRGHRPGVPAEVSAVVDKLMAKKPADRFQTPAELIQTLDHLTKETSRGRQGARRPLPRCHEPLNVCTSEGPLTVAHPVDAASPVSSDVRRFLGHTDEVMALDFMPDGRQLISAARDGTAYVWDVQTGEKIADLPDVGGILGLAVAPDGDWIALAGRDGTIRLWEPTTGIPVRRFAGHQGEVCAVAVSPDGQRLLSGGRDQTVRLWSMATGKEIRRIGGTVAERHWETVLAVAFAADGRRALSGSRDGSMRLWDTETGRELRCFRDHPGPVHGVAFVPHCPQLVSAAGNSALLWDAESGLILRRFTSHERPILALALSPDGLQLATGSEDATVRLWHVMTGEELRQHALHRAAVRTLAFAPDGQTVASGGADRTLLLWMIHEDGRHSSETPCNFDVKSLQGDESVT